MSDSPPESTVHGSPVPTGIEPSTEPAGRYRPVRPHARGGLGEVLYAEEDELGRPVALKRLRGQRADDVASRGRFLREATITARLQHPGIVPVYGLTQDERGGPAYAMRFIEGESLHDAIARHHQRADGRMTLRQLLARFVAVCETLAYAHSRGVIHRDIKPANIMLGGFGETLVVDWGLAKTIGESHDPAQLDTAGPPSDTADAIETRQGLVMGTPAYMSPEQAAGRWDEVGPASDVYSLGATLFQILTGRPAFSGDAAEVLSSIEYGPTPSARASSPKVNRALDAVCRKAMARRPADRYASAQALADDLNRWLADEPVTAEREAWWVRLGRWLRRHRTLATAMLALMVAGVVALAVGLWAVNQERIATATERDEARRQRGRTRAALDAMTSGLTERWLKSSRQLRPEQIEFLNQALTYYQDFARDAGNDFEGRMQVAQAQSRVAGLLYNLDRGREAEAAYRTALASWERLAGEEPNHLTCAKAVSEVGSNLGNLLKDEGRFDEAEPLLRKAVEAFEASARQTPADPAANIPLAWALNNWAVTLASQRKLPAAESAYTRAINSLETIVRATPSNDEAARDLANSCLNLGNLLKGQSRFPESEPYYRRSIDLYGPLARRHAEDPEYANDLARAHGNLAAMYATCNELDAAEKQYRLAMTTLETVTRDYPASTKFRTLLGLTYMNYSQLYRRRNQPVQTLEWIGRSEAVLRQVLDSGPKQVEPKNYLAIALLAKIDTQIKLTLWPDAVRSCGAALAIDDGRWAKALRVDRAWCRVKAGDLATGLAEARELARNEKSLSPEQLVRLAAAASLAGAPEDALALLRRAKEADKSSTQLWKDDPDFATLRTRREFGDMLQDGR